MLTSDLSTTVFDRDSVFEMADGDRRFVGELAELFAADLSSQLESLLSAVDRRDVTSGLLTAQRLRSRVECLGGRDAEARIRDFERLLRKASAAGARGLFFRITRALIPFLSKLHELTPSLVIPDLSHFLPASEAGPGPSDESEEAKPLVCDVCHRMIHDPHTPAVFRTRQEIHYGGQKSPVSLNNMERTMSDVVNNPVVFDRESVLDMVDGEVDFMQELIEMFLEDLPTHLETIRQGISTNDAESVQQMTHRLKSSVGNLGGRRAQPLVRELEQQARTGSVVGADDLFARCEFEIEQLQQELAKEL